SELCKGACTISSGATWKHTLTTSSSSPGLRRTSRVRSSRQLLEQVGIPDPCPERGHDDWVVGARDDVLLLREPPDVVPEGFVFLLCDLIEIPLNPRFRERPLEVVDELGAEISPGIDRIRWKSREPVLHGWRQDDGEGVCYGVMVTTCRFDVHHVDPSLRL